MKKESILTLSDGRIHSLVDYHPYNGGSRDENTYRIMDLKSVSNRNFQKSCLFFSGLLDNMLSSFSYPYGKLQIVIVPSSSEFLLSDGLVCIVNQLSPPPSIEFSSDYLVRHTTVEKARYGGGRSKNKHYDSIRIGADLYSDIPIMLLDDVTSTGNTLNACKDILMDQGYQNIVMVSIGCTVND